MSIPTDRLIKWEGNVGVPGGIPQRTNVVTALSPSGGNDTAAIQNALNAAPHGGVVVLREGSFKGGGKVSVPNGRVIRGEGPGTTFDGSFEMYEYQAWDDPIPLAANATKGDAAIALTRAPSILGVGMLVHLMQENDPSEYIEGAAFEGSGACLKGQWVRITSVSGATLGIDPPLYSNYSTELGARIRYPFLAAGGTSRNFLEYAGVEDLKLVNSDPTKPQNIFAGFAAYCWVKGVVSESAGVCHLNFHDSYRCEIRKSWINGVMEPLTSSRGYGIQLGTPNGIMPSAKTSGILIDDCIFEQCRGSILIGYGSAGGVISHNYFRDTKEELATRQKPDINLHSAFPTHFLVEGNIGHRFLVADNYHGNSGVITVRRNWVKVKGPGKTSALIGIGIDAFHRGYVVEGNVIGYDGIVFDVGALGGRFVRREEVPSPPLDYNNNAKGMMLGYDGEGGGQAKPDTQVAATLVDHGNFDYETRTQTWASADHSMPDSRYLTGKPAFFGGLVWPPVDPANPSAVKNTSLPAGWRREIGNEDYLGTTPTPPPDPDPTPDPEPEPQPGPTPEPPPVTPTVTISPASITARKGQSVTFSAVVNSSTPVAYQWWGKGGTMLAGKTGASLTLTKVNPGMTASYAVTVTNSFGQSANARANLIVR